MSSNCETDAPVESTSALKVDADKVNAFFRTNRRAFLARSSLAAAAAALPASMLMELGKARAAVLPEAVVTDALSGAMSFVVPGGDPYSVQQGVTSPTPGGVEGNGVLPLIFGLNGGGLAPPPFDNLSELVAFSLENVTPFVNPAPVGPFTSAFANLSFGEKAAVFSIMESGLAGPELVPLANALISLAGLMAYNEAGVFNPMTGELVATPVGWLISNYGGISDGHDDFQGYYGGVRYALPF